MKQKILISLIFLSCGFLLKGQVRNAWGQIGGSYMSDDDGGIQATLRTAVAFDLARLWSIGIKANIISYRDILPAWQQFWLAGPFVRLGIAPSERSRLYLESGIFLSDYRVDHNRLTNIGYRDPGLIYGSAGGGLEYLIWRSIFLDIGFHTHGLLNRARPHYAYNSYFVGVVVRLKEGM